MLRLRAAGIASRSRLPIADAVVTQLRVAGVHSRNEIVTGVGGKQIIVGDPSANPVELFQPTLPGSEARRAIES